MTERKVINLAERKQQRLVGHEPPTIEVELPDFITPPDISKLSNDQLEQLVNMIRLRRMTSVLEYDATMQVKEQKERDKVVMQIEKKGEQVFNELERCLKTLDKLELRVNEMRALRLQIGMEF